MSADASLILRKQPHEPSTALWVAGTALSVALWFALYSQLVPLADWIVSLLPLERGSHLEEAINFFIYDTPKVLMLLTLVVFAMGVVRSFFSPERTRASCRAARRTGAPACDARLEGRAHLSR